MLLAKPTVQHDLHLLLQFLWMQARRCSCLGSLSPTLCYQGTPFGLGKILTVLSSQPTHPELNVFPFAVIIIFASSTSASLRTSNAFNIAFCKQRDQRCQDTDEPAPAPVCCPQQPKGGITKIEMATKGRKTSLWSGCPLHCQNHSSWPGKLSKMKSAELMWGWI